MSTTRQDAWSNDEDILLAEIVLRHIREGGTQLQAFEEVGKLLSRTSAACGFRWNSYVRKQYKSGIEVAKKQRKQVKKSPVEEQPLEKNVQVEATEKKVEYADFNEVLAYLQGLHAKSVKWDNNDVDSAVVKEKTKELEEKLLLLQKENEELQNELDTIEDAYKALVDLMEKARQMVVLKD
ncbi:RsfA family transcriptional regulator [Bacillus sp. B1-b2]|uniref:RsfA family transcriptional regulator n=1 Tax=Bacillus sp. B1-b2 TaxID=2653201 RepID=UPI0012624975|nr:RsfA family transcriptional regulator [Bacillus sp. B1-b2]KAB7669276.1 RsfA family transcriptional regulator [Bacillus sp. B1-b2]